MEGGEQQFKQHAILVLHQVLPLWLCHSVWLLGSALWEQVARLRTAQEKAHWALAKPHRISHATMTYHTRNPNNQLKISRMRARKYI